MGTVMVTEHNRWEEAWKQVESRDGKARFLYGVRSTGVFCRPTCPSRRPAQQNVVFFQNAGEAMRAGFRACLRCQPTGIAAEAETLAKLCAHLKDNVDRKITLRQLALLADASPFTVQRLFQRVLGVSPQEYQRELRIQGLKRELANPQARVTDAIYDAGYSSSSRAYEDAPVKLGMSPRTFRQRGRGERIRFAIGECVLGRILVAATERGLCWLSLAESAADGERGLREEFGEAELKRDNSLKTLVETALATMAGGKSADLPLDLRGTAFQLRVWQALRAIPRGETRSYADIACVVGNPKAVRAVARACGSNPVAVVIPCHRVIGSDGKLTGYRWGVERKKKLLESESSR